ncbi:MAG: hypothetical protein IAF02_16455 [Anaerolineae bacterium]|nr:hypothetical protein [Anaerolineae bacterium]
MNILKPLIEQDSRYTMVKSIFDALNGNLRSLRRQAENADDEFEVEFVVEQAEWMYGIAFVTAQTYITGTIADANLLMKGKENFKKHQLLKDFSNKIEGANLTQLQLCDAIANYFKHHEEWGNWELVGTKKWTISLLAEVGINKQSGFPCYEAATTLCPEEDIVNLDYLLGLLVEWRDKTILPLLEEI